MKKYDAALTWRENLDSAPTLLSSISNHPPVSGEWNWCGAPMNSPLGVPAGPLLDARWLLYYASLGFDWLVYKTVRSSERGCHPLPNLVPVAVDSLRQAGQTLSVTDDTYKSWAVSFGMPSQPPAVWREDVTVAKNSLPTGKVLIVSVVGTQDDTISDPKASMEHLADDFATAAKWAVESGADAVEANFSCPNVSTSDGQLFQQPVAARLVAERIRAAIGDTPLALKIGHISEYDQAADFTQHVAPFVNGLAMTNSIAASVRKTNGEQLFDGHPRGICGDAIRQASIEQVRVFSRVISQNSLNLKLIGVGGISSAKHVESYLAAGASAVGLATAAMLQPDIGLKIRRELMGI